jgi:hypothetical protein
METFSKKIASCEWRREVSLPRKILATNVPERARTWVVMLRAASSSWA